MKKDIQKNLIKKNVDEIKCKNNIDKEYKVSTFILNNLIDYCELDREKAAITLDNAYMVETLLKIDSNYKKASKINEKPCIKFMKHIVKVDTNIDKSPDETIENYGSRAYWINSYIEALRDGEIKQKISGTINRIKKTETFTITPDIALKGVICAIDRENSTHLTADHVGRRCVFEKINRYVNYDIRNLEKGLKNFDLIDEIATPIEQIPKSISGEKKGKVKERYHFSFATKFCRYVCLQLFNNKVEADTFYIYDNVLKNNLDFYAEEYEVNKFKFEKFDIGKNTPKNQYIKYTEFLDKIKENAKKKHKDSEEISRNALDHIIWYFNK
ncbi:MAG: hypothetical protein IKG14_00160 [Clostridia bacterium]|nr:hypothetical protein [Clostridia bacterium]